VDDQDEGPDELAYAALLARRRRAAHVLAIAAIAIVTVILILGALQARRYDTCMRELDCAGVR
jgi:DNA-binding transcriptional regulator of glucitol operon